MILRWKSRIIRRKPCHGAVFAQHKAKKDRSEIELRPPQGQALAIARPIISCTTQEYNKVLG
jgi:hypothetical protein